MNVQSPRGRDERGRTNGIISAINKANNRAEKYKTQRDLQEHFRKIAEQDVYEGLY